MAGVFVGILFKGGQEGRSTPKDREGVLVCCEGVSLVAVRRRRGDEAINSLQA